jgi:hypothetical protein
MDGNLHDYRGYIRLIRPKGQSRWRFVASGKLARTDTSGMQPEVESNTLTAEALAIQILSENEALAKKYACGDLAAMELLQEKARRLSSGRLNEESVKAVLLSKLGAGI